MIGQIRLLILKNFRDYSTLTLISTFFFLSFNFILDNFHLRGTQTMFKGTVNIQNYFRSLRIGLANHLKHF